MTSLIHFSKMHGLGNDFIVIDGIKQSINLPATKIQSLANRHTGIGFDQLLLIKSSSIADFACKIYNADGSEAEQCGNGMRCVARFVHEKGLTSKKILTIETKAGVISTDIKDYDNIEVSMGIPEFEPQKIPFSADSRQDFYHIDIDSELLKMSVLSMGNPHAIFLVNDVKNYPVHSIGAQVEKNAAFPNATNVGFMEIIDSSHIRLRTFERGVGETLACGTNACAAAIAGMMNHKLDSKVIVELNLGNLSIEWQGEGHPVMMTGPASHVFDGVTTDC